MSPVLKLGRDIRLWEESVKNYILFLWGRPGALWACQRPRKPITYACGMIPERCGPPPTRTARPGGLGSAGASRASVDEPFEPPDEPEKLFQVQVALFWSQNLSGEF